MSEATEFDNSTLLLKDAFAMAILFKPDEPLQAALEAMPDKPDFAVWVAKNWLYDPYVEAKKLQYLNQYGAEHFLPGKIQIARKLWQIAEATGYATVSERLVALKQYAEVVGVTSNSKATNVNVKIQNNKVLVVKDHGSDDSWEEKALAQQSQLTIEAQTDG